jgi:hypothetical protein
MKKRLRTVGLNALVLLPAARHSRTRQVAGVQWAVQRSGGCSCVGVGWHQTSGVRQEQQCAKFAASHRQSFRLCCCMSNTAHCKLQTAVLCCAVLCCAVLCCAVLCCAVVATFWPGTQSPCLRQASATSKSKRMTDSTQTAHTRHNQRFWVPGRPQPQDWKV